LANKFWLEILLALPAITSFIGIIIGGFVFKKLDTIYKYILIYLIMAFTVDLLSRFLIQNNLIAVPVFGFIELLLFSMLYNELIFSKNLFFKPIIGFFLLFILIDIITSKASTPKHFQSFGRVLDGFSIVFFSLYFYWKVLKEGVLKHLKTLRLNTGIFLFFLLNSLWFLIANFLVNTPYKLVFSLWLINIIATPLFYSFLTFHVWQNGKHLKQ
jgi:hypothetical protein